MRITDIQVQKAYELHLRKIMKTEANAPADAGRAPDEAVFSRKAMELQKAKQAAADLPPIREQVVRDIRQQIEADEYSVTSDELAESMFNCALGDGWDE